MANLSLLEFARSFSMVLCAAMLAVVLVTILATHWAHRRKAESHFHATTFSEMSWSLAPMLMVLAVVTAALKDFWLL